MTQAVARPAGLRGRLPALALDPVAVFLVALVVRVGTVLVSQGGPRGYFGYDAGVYYTASDAVLHGQMPYSGFTLVHPPGIVWALLPFAAVGLVVGDHAGFILANSAFEVLGALNAVLILLVARRAGFGRRAALLGAGFYTLWYGPIQTDVAVRLEPLGTALFLAGLLVLTGARTRGRLALAGALLGATVTVKIWWVVPAALAMVLVGDAQGGRVRRLRPLVAGAAGAVVLVLAPCLVTAPRTMWRMVVTDQLGRGHGISVADRVLQLTSVHNAVPHAGHAVTATLVALTLVLFGAVLLAAWGVPAARPFVVVALAQLVVLAATPIYFPYYAGYPAGALALAVAGAAQRAAAGVPVRRWGLRAAGATVAAATVLTFSTLALHRVTLSTAFPIARFSRAVAHVRCLMTDSPGALIELNVLNRTLAAGCPNWVDVAARTYGADYVANTSRRHNLKWQRDIAAYLQSGDAVLVVRKDTGLSRATLREVYRGPLLAEEHGLQVHAVRASQRHSA